MTLGRLFVISAPSGAGKTSLVAALLKATPNLCVSISHTTRVARPHEQHGINYFFVDEVEFKNMVTANAFIEHAQVFSHSYGTSRAFVEQQLHAGKDVILEIDWQGGQQIRKMMPESISIFVLPPSKEVLLQRLQNRGQDHAEVIAARMAAATTEMQHYREYDYLVINDDFATAVADLQTIIFAQRLRQPRQAMVYADLLEQLIE